MVSARSVNHIGVAVKSLEEHRYFYETVLGATFENVEEVPSQHVRVAFYRLGPPGHEIRIELLEPTSPDSAVATFIDKRGEGLHHIAYTVDDIDARLAALRAADFRLIDQTPREGAHHARIAFLHPKASMGVLTELCQPATRNQPSPAPGSGEQT